MRKIILFNKPFKVLSQFTDEHDRKTLADYIQVPHVYPCGRLDRDSEGLMLLSDDGQFQRQVSHPDFKMIKTYWVQVEGEPTTEALHNLRKGVHLKDGLTLPAQVRQLTNVSLWDRDPPVRFRKTVADSWLEVSIRQGKNRQVRRMTAAVGYPTLRLVRVAIGPYSLGNLQPGQWREISPPQDEPSKVL